MITRASRFYFALGAAGYLLAVVYGMLSNGAANGGALEVLTGDGVIDTLLGPLTFGYKGGVGDHIGYGVLLAFSATNFLLGGLTSAFRDGSPEALAELDQSDSVPLVSQPADLSPWPVVMAFGAGLATIGLATGPQAFTIGLTIMVLSGIEWMVKDWSERATGDPEVNATIRRRIMSPIELPVGGLLLIGVVVFAFSRILLASSKNGAILGASVIGLVIFGVAIALSFAPKIKRGLVVGVLVAGAIVVLALGIIGAVQGERDFEVHGEEHALGASASPALSGVER